MTPTPSTVRIERPISLPSDPSHPVGYALIRQNKHILWISADRDRVEREIRGDTRLSIMPVYLQGPTCSSACPTGSNG